MLEPFIYPEFPKRGPLTRLRVDQNRSSDKRIVLGKQKFSIIVEQSAIWSWRVYRDHAEPFRMREDDRIYVPAT